MLSSRRALAAGAAVLAAGAIAASPATAATKAPPKLTNVTATADVLSRRFMDALAPGGGADAKLRAFLSPAFIIERSNSTTNGWPGYLVSHPTFTSYSVTVTRAQYRAPVMTVLAVTSGIQLMGGAPVTSAPGSNLATYAWTPRGWKITSYARFNAVN